MRPMQAVGLAFTGVYLPFACFAHYRDSSLRPLGIAAGVLMLATCVRLFVGGAAVVGEKLCVVNAWRTVRIPLCDVAYLELGESRTWRNELHGYVVTGKGRRIAIEMIYAPASGRAERRRAVDILRKLSEEASVPLRTQADLDVSADRLGNAVDRGSGSGGRPR